MFVRKSGKEKIRFRAKEEGRGEVPLKEMDLNRWKGQAGEVPVWGRRQRAFEAQRGICIFS